MAYAAPPHITTYTIQHHHTFISAHRQLEPHTKPKTQSSAQSHHHHSPLPISPHLTSSLPQTKKHPSTHLSLSSASRSRVFYILNHQGDTPHCIHSIHHTTTHHIPVHLSHLSSLVSLSDCYCQCQCHRRASLCTTIIITTITVRHHTIYLVISSLLASPISSGLQKKGPREGSRHKMDCCLGRVFVQF